MRVFLNGTEYRDEDFQGYGYVSRFPTKIFSDALAEFKKTVSAGTTLSATSATSLTIGAGSKTFTVEPGKSFVPGMWVIAQHTNDAVNCMIGQVVNYDGSLGSLEINVLAPVGSGTFSDWTIGTQPIQGGGADMDGGNALTMFDPLADYDFDGGGA